MIEQRHQLNLTQRELADLCGIPHSSVARIESGKTTPNLSTLLKIFQKLGITLTATPINAELVELDKARKMPITYDEWQCDSAALTRCVVEEYYRRNGGSASL